MTVDEASWAVGITIGGVLVGALIAVLTAGVVTWLTNRDRRTARNVERRESRLYPVYLGSHNALRDWVRLLELHHMGGFAPDQPPAAQLAEAFEHTHRLSYQIDLMSPPELSAEFEHLEDELISLTEGLGYRLRSFSIPADVTLRAEGAFRTRLTEISNSRIRLMRRMQYDLGLVARLDLDVGVRDFNRLLQR